MSDWTRTGVTFGLMTVVMLALTYFYLDHRSKSPDADRSRIEREAREFSSYIALALFVLFTLVTTLVTRHSVWRFVEVLPFKPIFQFAQHWFSVPGGRSDLRGLYSTIWYVLAFMVPCLIFAVFSASLASSMWQSIRAQKPRRH